MPNIKYFTSKTISTEIKLRIKFNMEKQLLNFNRHQQYRLRMRITPFLSLYYSISQIQKT